MAARRGWQAGRAGYLLTTLTELRRFENRRDRGSPSTARSLERSVLLVAIANGAYYGGGMRIAPDAAPDDGRLDLCVVGDISRLTAIRELPNLYRGTHVRNSGSLDASRAAIVDRGRRARRGRTSTASPSAASRCASSSVAGAPPVACRPRRSSTPHALWLAPMDGARHRGRCSAASAPRGRRIGTVDAVFADYLLVRTSGLLPVDLYVPRTEVRRRGRSASRRCGRREAYERWHRPLKRAPHDD